MAIFGFVGVQLAVLHRRHRNNGRQSRDHSGIHAHPGADRLRDCLWNQGAASCRCSVSCLTLAGVTLIAAQGKLEVLLALAVNPGDGVMLIACVLYSGYTLALQKPSAGVSPHLLCCSVAHFRSITSVPGPVLRNGRRAAAQWPTLSGLAGRALYCAVFPSFLSQIFFMRGVELIGPARAGVFINLVPIFAAILAVSILGEQLQMAPRHRIGARARRHLALGTKGQAADLPS